MEAALEFHELVALAIGTGETHCVVRRLGTRRNEPYLFGARHRLNDGLGQLNARSVVGEECRAASDLFLYCCHDLRMGMTKHHGARAQDEVDVFVSDLIPHPSSSALAINTLRRQVA